MGLRSLPVVKQCLHLILVETSLCLPGFTQNSPEAEQFRGSGNANRASDGIRRWYFLPASRLSDESSSQQMQTVSCELRLLFSHLLSDPQPEASWFASTMFMLG